MSIGRMAAMTNMHTAMAGNEEFLECFEGGFFGICRDSSHQRRRFTAFASASLHYRRGGGGVDADCLIVGGGACGGIIYSRFDL